MTRSPDLDIIAPDDPIIIPEENKKETVLKKTSPLKTKKKKKSISKKIDLREKACSILGQTTHCYSSFLINPKFFDFVEREPGETILLAIRSHWSVNSKWILSAFSLLFVPFFLSILDIFQQLPVKYQIVSVLFWYLIIFIYSFEKFLDWYFDVFIITDRRLVDIKFNNLLNKHFAEAELRVIQDVSSSVRGIFGTFFNYGDILIQTASEVSQITFRNVRNPEKVIKLLQELRGDYHTKHPRGRL